MAEQTNTQELDTPEETLTNPAPSTPEAPANSNPNGESATPSASKSKDDNGTNTGDDLTNPSKGTDKADWKWKEMRKSIKSSHKEIKRKDAEIADLKRQLEELRTANQSASGYDLIKGINKEGRLEDKIEQLQKEDDNALNEERNSYLTKLAEDCLKGDELAKYNAEIAPRVQATLEDLNNISPIVARFIATSKDLPLFMNEIAEMVKAGEDVQSYIKNVEAQSFNVYTGKPDPQIAWNLMKEWEAELKDRHSSAQVPETVKKPKAPTTASVNSPAAGNNDDGYDIEAIKRYRGA